MRNLFFISIYTLIIILSSVKAQYAQDRFQLIEDKLKSLTEIIPALDQKVDVSVNSVSIQEFVRGIATSANINLSVDPTLNIKVTNSFNQIAVRDILLFLCRVYKLDIAAIGSIVNIVEYKEPQVAKPIIAERKVNIAYEVDADLISFDLKNDTLAKVTKEITNLSSKNIALSQGLGNSIVSGFVKQMPFDAALEKLCYSNGLVMSKADDQFYLIEKNEEASTKDVASKSKKKSFIGQTKGRDDLLASSKDSITLTIDDQSIVDVISSVSNKLGVPYSYLSEIKGNATIRIQNKTYEEFLFYILKGTGYTYMYESGIFFIGDKKLDELKVTQVIPLHYRTVEKIKDIIPQSLIKELEVNEFIEQNSLIVSGNIIAITTLENLIYSIDKIVPVVLIEVIIVDVRKSVTVSAGISAGINPSAPNTKSLLPSTDWTLGSKSLNSLINSFNGFGWVKLGKVSPNFYLQIKALEDNGLLKIRSTPKLSTLNGHEAILNSGETKYYKEEQSNYFGSQNPSLSNSYTWKAINADLNVTIKPIVSSDDQITLDIKVEQSEFTQREYENSPPGSVNRTFQSLVRVKNEEMVLLGGLEKTTKNNTSSGVPLLSRIPVIRWFFGNRTKSDSDTKLNIFIKPTIIY